MSEHIRSYNATLLHIPPPHSHTPLYTQFDTNKYTGWICNRASSPCIYVSLIPRCTAFNFVINETFDQMCSRSS